MYIIKKKGKRDYYYLRKSIRVNGKVKTKDIAYLGKTKKIAEKKLKQMQQPKKEVVPKKTLILNINDIATFCKKKGFVYPNSEIYGSFSGFFDYGPLGVELKNNIKQSFWKTFVQEREDVVGIDGTIISSPKVWEASGHVSGFTDYLYKCEKCNLMYKGEDNKGMKCPKCGSQLENSSKFNLMFQTNVGPTAEKNIAFLRPETAQQMFVNFKLVQENARLKLPFGIAQIGRAFRNEISPRDFLFRSREFEQMEIEYFVHPDKLNNCQYLNEVENLKVNILTADKKEVKEIKIKDIIDKKLATAWHAYWLGKIYRWFLDLGINPQNLRLREHQKEELAHYAKACFDIEYKFPFGWKEIHGDADRQQFDLQQHIKFSKQNLSLFDEETKQKIIPYVAAEPSQGVDRAFLAFLTDAYYDDKERENIVLKLHPKLAPIKAAVFPLVSNDKRLVNKSHKVYEILKKEFNCFYDSSGSIGRRYARQDESGTPLCITLDFDSLKKKGMTIRDRNTTKQIRVKEKDLIFVIRKLLNQEIKFEKAGKLVN